MTELDLKTNEKLVLPAVPSSEVYNEDCVEALKRFPDKHFDLAIVDPPYGIDYVKIAASLSGKKFKSCSGIKGKYSYYDWDKSIPTAEYWEQLFRVSKNQIVWGGNYMTEYLPPKMGWIFWNKGNGANRHSDGELAWTSFNKALRMFKVQWCGGSQYDFKNKEIRIHPTQKPIPLYEHCFKYAELKYGDLILDTHLGSGSSRIAAYKGGFNFVAFEINVEYYDKQEKRFNDFKSQLRLF